MKLAPLVSLSIVGLFLALSAVSCGRPAASSARNATPAGGAPVDSAGGAVVKTEAPEPSDLDRPVDELFKLTCEHRKKTFECDECRYETGVVRAPASLFAGGLLKAQPITRQRIRISLQLTGEVQFDARRVSHLGTQAEGTVRDVRVALGERVKRGQALIEIESVAVGEAEGAFLEAQAVLRLARRNHERVAGLRAEAIASEREFLQSRQELEAAEIRAASTEGVLTRLGTTAADVKNLSQASARGCLTLRAPADGVLLSLHAVPGERARTDEDLATIGDKSTLWVWCDLYERDLAKIHPTRLVRNLPATVSVRAFPGEEFPGTLDFVSPAMEEASRTVRLRVLVNNPEGRLLPGMFADVKVFLPGAEQGLAVPRDAVLEDAGRSFVFIRHHGEYYVRRPVTLGRTWGDRVEVVSGLRGGEVVVAGGSFLMKSDVLRSKMGAGCAD